MIAAAVAASFAAPTSSQPASGPEGILALKTAAEAARLGEERQDPWALALAARLRLGTPVTPVKRVPEEATPPAPIADRGRDWIERARELGRYDPRLQAFLDELETAVFRGRQGGPRVSAADLHAAGAHRYRERFHPSAPAAVYVEGDGDTDLLLVVTNSDGSEACREDGPGDVKLCFWTPGRAGQHTIQVTNRGAVRNRYILATN